MAWATVGTASGGRGTTGTSVNTTLPGSAAAGDLLVLALTAQSGGVPGTPTGWTAFPSVNPPNGPHTYGFWYRVFQTGDSGPTLTWASSGAYKWGCVAWRDTAQGGNVIHDTDAVINTGAALAHPVASRVSRRADAISILVCGTDATAGSGSGVNQPSGYAEARDEGGAVPGLSIAWVGVGATTVSPADFTSSGNARSAATLHGIFFKGSESDYPVATKAVLSSVTSHVVNLPDGIQAGDLLIATASVRNAGTWTPPDASWIEFGSQDSGGVGELTVFYRICTGSEGATATWTASATTTGAWQVRRIPAADWDGTVPPEVAFSTSGGLPGSAINPPSITPSWGSDDTLFLAVGGGAAENVAITSYPSGYLDGAWAVVSAGGAGAYIGTSYLRTTTATEDPGAYTTGAARWWYGATIAIKPSSGSTPEEHEGEAHLSAIGELDATGTKQAIDDAALTARANLDASGVRAGVGDADISAQVSIAGTGEKSASKNVEVSAGAGLSADAAKRADGTADVGAVAGLAATGSRAEGGDVTIAAIAGLDAEGAKQAVAGADIGAGAGIDADGTKRAHGAASLGAVAGLDATGSQVERHTGTASFGAVAALDVADGVKQAQNAIYIDSVAGLNTYATRTATGTAGISAIASLSAGVPTPPAPDGPYPPLTPGRPDRGGGRPIWHFEPIHAVRADAREHVRASARAVAITTARANERVTIRVTAHVTIVSIAIPAVDKYCILGAVDTILIQRAGAKALTDHVAYATGERRESDDEILALLGVGTS